MKRSLISLRKNIKTYKTNILQFNSTSTPPSFVKPVAIPNPLIKKSNKPVIVLLGGGWGGYRVLKGIDLKNYIVKLVSPRNHFLFTPLLASTSVGTLEFRSVSEPLHSARNNHDNYFYYNASAKKIDLKNKEIECMPQHEGDNLFTLTYDKLIVSVGCDVNTMGVKGVTENANFLKELRDARNIRNKVIECFERAANPKISLQLRERLLRFVVVGAGPTGIEASAEIHDFIHQDLSKLFPELALYVQITVLEASNSVLNAFDVTLQEYAKKRFRRQGIKVQTGVFVREVNEDHVLLHDGSRIECGFVLWSAGIQARKLLMLDERSPDLPKNKLNKILVNENLEVIGHKDVYAIGDCSSVVGSEFNATAQVAQQQGKYLANKLNHEIDPSKGPYPKQFVYEHRGTLAYLGSYRAVSDDFMGYKKGKFKGAFSWFLWRSAYMTNLVSIKNKILVPFDWMKTFIFGRDTSKF